MHNRVRKKRDQVGRGRQRARGKRKENCLHKNRNEKREQREPEIIRVNLSKTSKRMTLEQKLCKKEEFLLSFTSPFIYRYNVIRMPCIAINRVLNKLLKSAKCKQLTGIPANTQTTKEQQTKAAGSFVLFALHPFQFFQFVQHCCDVCGGGEAV